MVKRKGNEENITSGMKPMTLIKELAMAILSSESFPRCPTIIVAVASKKNRKQATPAGGADKKLNVFSSSKKASRGSTTTTHFLSSSLSGNSGTSILLPFIAFCCDCFQMFNDSELDLDVIMSINVCHL